MKKEISKQVYEDLADFRYQLRKFLHFSDSEARKFGITPQQHQLLLSVMGIPGKESATLRELAERLQITHHACVGLVDRSEQAGLVARRQNPEDGRSVLIDVTEKGKNILEKLSEIHLAEIERIGFLKEKGNSSTKKE